MSMSFRLSEDIISTEDLRDVSEEIKRFKQWFSHNQIKLKVTQHHKAANRPELSDAAEDLLNQARDNKELTIAKIESLLDYIDDCLRKSPTVRITLAAIPSSAVKHQIVAWLRANISSSILTDFRFNTSLLGGMVVISGSHIYDWSVRRQLLDSKDKLSGVLSRV